MKAITWWRRSRKLILCGTLSVAFSLSSRASARGQEAPDKGWDILDQMRRVEKVASQKLDMQVRTAIVEAEKLAAKDADKAVARLLTEITNIEADNATPKEHRELAIKQIRSRINQLQGAAANDAIRADEQEKKDKALARQRLDRDQFAQDVADVKARLAGIGKLQEDGNFAGASKEAADLNKHYPEIAASRAIERSAETAEKSATYNKELAKKNEGLFSAFHDVSRSATLPKGDIDYPQDWAEKTKRRSTASQMTTKERAIMKALASPITLTFKNSRFEAALDLIRAKTGQPILLDPEALKEVDASYDSPITIDARALTLRTALHKVLGEIGLTYIIKDESIYVTSATRARETMVIKRYYIGDLLASMNTTNSPQANTGLPIQTTPPIKGFITPLGTPGLIYGGNVPMPWQAPAQTEMLQNQAQTMENARLIMDMIKNSVDPHSWTTSNGAGTITFHPGSLSVIIKQTAEMHALLGAGF